MIPKIRHGATAAAKSDAYRDYPNETGVPAYRATENRGENGRAHFLTVSFWKPMEPVKKFAGPDREKAGYNPEDEKFLLVFEAGSSITRPSPDLRS